MVTKQVCRAVYLNKSYTLNMTPYWLAAFPSSLPMAASPLEKSGQFAKLEQCQITKLSSRVATAKPIQVAQGIWKLLLWPSEL